MAIAFDHKPGLVVYLTAGDQASMHQGIALAAIDAGAAVIELGVHSAILWRTVR